MSDYNKIARLAIQKAKYLTEGISYPEGMTERMHPVLEKELKNQKHSLGKHPIFPEGDESSFEEKIMGERFNDVVKRYKRVHELEHIDNNKALKDMMPMVKEVMELEYNNKKELEQLAIKMIREEYDMVEDVVEINATLTADISLENTQLNATPSIVDDIEFDSHAEVIEAKDEVYKRRFINAMIQGAAKKCNQMFHMVEDELVEIDPRLPNKYSKMMATADYMYYIIEDLTAGTAGGVVNVEFPSKNNPKAVINASAMVFPVLIHELVKGVMEILSAHGLPKNKKMGKYVIAKADFLNAEPWDMRLGPALWERFTECIDAEDFNLKHHIYSELVTLPVAEFNIQMKEIMAGTKKGKKIVKDLSNKINHELHEDEFNEAMRSEKGDDEGDESFNWDEFKGIL